jgi:hypothetical protein
LKREFDPIEVWGEREGLKSDIKCHIENSDDPTRYILMSIRQWAESKGVNVFKQVGKNG